MCQLIIIWFNFINHHELHVISKSDMKRDRRMIKQRKTGSFSYWNYLFLLIRDSRAQQTMKWIGIILEKGSSFHNIKKKRYITYVQVYTSEELSSSATILNHCLPNFSRNRRAFSRNDGPPSISSRASKIGLPTTKDLTGRLSLPEWESSSGY